MGSSIYESRDAEEFIPTEVHTGKGAPSGEHREADQMWSTISKMRENMQALDKKVASILTLLQVRGEDKHVCRQIERIAKLESVVATQNKIIGALGVGMIYLAIEVVGFMLDKVPVAQTALGG